MHSILAKAIFAALVSQTIYAAPAPAAGTPPKGQPFETSVENSELLANLATDLTATRRYQRLLTKDGKLIGGTDLTNTIVFDINGGPPVPGSRGGVTATSSIENFPFSVGSGLSFAKATIGPCGVLLPHVHNRANEFFLVTEGVVDFGTMIETGLFPGQPNPTLTGTMEAYQGTYFPQGTVHYQMNNSPDCKTATIVTALNSEDPGVQPILGTPSGNVTMRDPEDFRPFLAPALVKAIDSCNARCYPDA